MRSASKQIHYQSLQQLQLASKELASEDHRYQEKLKLIVASAFGTDSNKGIIPPRIEYYYRKTPINWAEEHDTITRLFAPSSDIMSGPNGLLATADYPIAIDPKILPKSVLSEFPPRGDKQSTMLKSLKRELGEKYFINTWQWFWANLAHALATLPEIQERRTMEEEEGEDEMFYLLTRNPLLAIARKALQHSYRKQSHLLDRLRGIFQLYIIEQLLSSTRSRQGRPQYRYQLRSHHLGMMFLLINSRSHTLCGQPLQIYQEYFLNATEHYSAISAQSNNQNVRYLMRLWTFLLTREHGLDGNLVKQVDNANPRDGWYRLARCPLEKWLEGAKKTEFLSYELPVITSIRNNFYRLLKKQTEWTPNFSFLAVLEQFLELDRVLLHRYIKRQAQREEDETVTRCFERILTHLAENGADCQLLQDSQSKLNIKFKETLGKTITINFAERSQEAKRKLSKTSRQNSKSISYQNPRIRNFWEHPLQENQFSILLTGSLWVSKQLDRVIPGHSKRTYPCLNLRIFANPYIFFITFLIIVIALRSTLVA